MAGADRNEDKKALTLLRAFLSLKEESGKGGVQEEWKG
jgi:hypothetical protein